MGLRIIDRGPGGRIDHDVVTHHGRKTGLRIGDVQRVAVRRGHLVDIR